MVAWQWRDVPPPEPMRFRFDLFESSGLLRLARGLTHDLRRWKMMRTFSPERYSLDAVLRNRDEPGVNEAWGVMPARPPTEV